jgi:hypothetical protein
MATRVSRTGQRSSTRRRGGRRRSRAVKLLKVMLQILVAFAIAYCVKAAIAKAARPTVINYREKKEVALLQQQIGAARAENIQLKGDITDIDTKPGKVSEARKLGWVKKGETAIVVEQPQKTALETAEPIAGKSCWRRAGDWLAGLFHHKDPTPVR